jgi:hypothetical protein
MSSQLSEVWSVGSSVELPLLWSTAWIAPSACGSRVPPVLEAAVAQLSALQRQREGGWVQPERHAGVGADTLPAAAPA